MPRATSGSAAAASRSATLIGLCSATRAKISAACQPSGIVTTISDVTPRRMRSMTSIVSMPGSKSYVPTTRRPS